MTLLHSLLYFSVFSAVCLFFIPATHSKLLKQISLLCSFILLFLTICLWITFQPLIFKFQAFSTYTWLFGLNFFINIGIDGLSIIFLMLTALLFVICFLFNWQNIVENLKEYLILLFIIEFFLFLIFISLDIFFFYFFFESLLIPFFLLIGLWGSGTKKIKAAYLFFFYTLAGSIGFLAAIIYIYLVHGITTYPMLYWLFFTQTEQVLLWVAFFFAFASKIPMFPFHIWLPEAHVEAPTTGSVLLAGVLLKLGVYGFLRFLLPLFPFANHYYLPLIYTLALLGIIYPAITAIRQTDLKKIIAYSSVSHMNLIVLGIFSFSIAGLKGAVLQSLSHGLVASGLFLLIGFLYDKYHTRVLKYYGGLIQSMPLFAYFFLFFSLCNMGIPGTSNFIGEFLILVTLFSQIKSVAILGALGMILCSLYTLWLTNRLLYGNWKNVYISTFSDITFRESCLITVLSILILVLGLCPTAVLGYFSFL